MGTSDFEAEYFTEGNNSSSIFKFPAKAHSQT